MNFKFINLGSDVFFTYLRTVRVELGSALRTIEVNKFSQYFSLFQKIQCADNFFIWLLILVPLFNIIYFILTLIRVVVDKVECVPFGREIKLQHISGTKSGSAYLTFVSLAVAGSKFLLIFYYN